MNPEPRADTSLLWKLAAFGLAAIVLIGAAIVLFNLVAWRTALVIACLLVVLVALRVWGDVLLPLFVRIAGAVVVAALALLAANWAWAGLGLPRPRPWIGLLFFACPVAFLALWAYFRTWWVAPPRGHAAVWAAATTLVLVVVLPFGIVGYKMLTEDEKTVPKSAPVLSQLRIGVIGGDGAPGIPRTAKTRGWRIQLSRGKPRGTGVDWGGDGEPQWRDDSADPVLLLLVDGAPRSLERAGALPDVPGRRGEVARWLAIARAAAPRGVPAYVILQTRDTSRLERWRTQLAQEDEESDGRRRGEVISLQAHAGNRTVVDVALRAVVDSPTFDEDLAVAARHRPLIYFDGDEETYTPLNVDRLLEKGRFRLCSRLQPPTLSLCRQVTGPGDLENGGNNLGFDTAEVANETDGSTIYVNVTRRLAGRRERAYLDYWWYLPDNPTGSANGALCGAGFVIAGWTCFDHQSDWEGVTVVTERRSRAGPFEPIAVHYPAHEGRTRYTWSALEARWKQPSTRRVVGNVEATARPLVFVARGTHAAYPAACHRKRCDKAPAPLHENPHNGRRPWAQNQCELGCLTALPERNRGTRPALWNAFDGRWGTTECDLVALCSSSNAPRSPGHQGRYSRPWCATASVTLQGRRALLDARVPQCDETAPISRTG